MAAAPRLHLTLEPIVPVRAPDGYQWLGYRLRLPDGGPLVTPTDPLLEAFGAMAGKLFVRDELEEELQHEAFVPGQELRLELEPFDPEDPDLVTAWSADGSVQAGELHDPAAKRVRAGLEHGLSYRTVIVAERRAVVDDRREGLAIIVLPTWVELAPAPPALRPTVTRPVRRRIVLVAGEDGDLRWWEAAVHGGPLALDELPLSPDYRERFGRVAEQLEEHTSEPVGDARGFARAERWMEGTALAEEVTALWTRARAELGARYLAGCRLPGEAVRWTDDDYDTEDIPF